MSEILVAKLDISLMVSSNPCCIVYIANATMHPITTKKSKNLPWLMVLDFLVDLYDEACLTRIDG